MIFYLEKKTKCVLNVSLLAKSNVFPTNACLIIILFIAVFAVITVLIGGACAGFTRGVALWKSTVLLVIQVKAVPFYTYFT